MISKKVQLFAFFIVTLTSNVSAAQQTTPVVKQQVSAVKAESPADNGRTYRDEVEIIKFDEYTGRDSFAVPVDEDALEKKQEGKLL